MDDWANDLKMLWDFSWKRLQGAATDTGSPMHRPTLATIGPDHQPRARIVVLRHADPSDKTLEAHSDAAAAKVGELRENPHATLLFWDSDTALQLRARVTVRIVTDDHEVWDALGHGARVNYGGTPATGTAIPAPDAYDKTPDPARHARLVGNLTSLDAVYLGRHHRRALFRAEDGFAGGWLAP